MIIFARYLGFISNMEIIKVIGVGIIGVVIAGLLKKDKPEFHLFIIMATGLIILFIILSSLSEVVNSFSMLVDKSGVNDALFSGVLKIIGIGYLTEYASSICTDYGSTSVANKLQLAGKITIFLMALPIINALIDVIVGIV